ncbi:MAG TPA: hypothetical protein VJ840_03330 [Gemmatimonadaceae bacterium]|nr:hypothetical protein [Gemmatimonadaceae bacterium]
MRTSTERYEEDSSFFALGASLLRSRWRIVRFVIAGMVVATLALWLSAPSYTATASFIPQGNDASKSGLATLAGQFGVSIPAGDQSLSPDFYSQLVRSRVLLERIARDTLVVAEKGGRRMLLADLLGISDKSARRREERVVGRLQEIVGASVAASTGLVNVRATTRWPSVSLAIVNGLVLGVNSFDQTTRQSQATAERRFVEERLAVARSELRAAEDRLEFFLKTNRDITGSPGALFEKDRLQRDVDLQRNVFNSLTQSLEDARIREVRDTPLITVVESPEVPSVPQSKHWPRTIVLGGVTGGIVGAIVALLSALIERRKQRGDPEAEEFETALAEVKGELLSPVRRLRARARR